MIAGSCQLSCDPDCVLSNAVPRSNEVIGSLIFDYLLEIGMNKLFSFAFDGIWKI